MSWIRLQDPTLERAGEGASGDPEVDLTAGPAVPSVGVLRELFRNLQAFRAVFESDGVDTIIGPDGVAWCLHDIEYLHRQLPLLPPRQRQAIELFLIQNVRESDAAVMMGVSRTNPIGTYATAGLTKLVAMIEDGSLPRFRMDDDDDTTPSRRTA